MKYFLTAASQLPRLDQIPAGHTVRAIQVGKVLLLNHGIEGPLMPEDELYLSTPEGVVLYTFRPVEQELAGPAMTPIGSCGDVFIPIQDLGFSGRVAHRLMHGRRRKGGTNWNMRYLGDICERTEKDLMDIKLFGETALKEVKEVLAKHGRSLKPSGDIMTNSIDVLNLKGRAPYCLKADNLQLVRDVCDQTEVQLLKIPGLGRRGLESIKEALAAHGLSLKQG